MVKWFILSIRLVYHWTSRARVTIAKAHYRSFPGAGRRSEKADEKLHIRTRSIQFAGCLSLPAGLLDLFTAVLNQSVLAHAGFSTSQSGDREVVDEKGSSKGSPVVSASAGSRSGAH